jgi:hypothetical protein
MLQMMLGSKHKVKNAKTNIAGTKTLKAVKTSVRGSKTLGNDVLFISAPARMIEFDLELQPSKQIQNEDSSN